MKKWLSAFLVLGLFATAVAVLYERGEATGIQWLPETSYEYDVSWRSKTNAKLDARQEPLQMDWFFSGRIAVNGYPDDGKGRLLGIEVVDVTKTSLVLGNKPIQMDEAQEPPESYEQLFRLADDGTIVMEYEHRAASKFLSSLTRSIAGRVTAPTSDGKQRTWIVDERLPLGVAHVEYVRRDSTTIDRKMLRYAELDDSHIDVDSAGQEVHSEGELVFGGDGVLQSLSSDDSITFLRGDQLQLSAHDVFSLSLVRTLERQNETADPALGKDWISRAPGQPDTAPQASDAATARARIGSLTLESVKETLARYAKGGHASDKWLWQVAELLRQHPEYAYALEGLGTDPDISFRGRAMVMDVLTSAGTPEAQDVMREVVGASAEFGEVKDYVELVQRFLFVTDPTEESLDFLFSDYTDRSGDRQRSAANALGALAGRLHRAEKSAEALEVADRLRSDLRAAENPRDRVALVMALGASGLPDNAHVLGEFLDDPVVDVRVALAGAMKGLERDTAQQHLVTLAKDDNPRVLRAALATLSEIEGDASVVESLATLASEGELAATGDLWTMTFLGKRLDVVGAADAIRQIAERHPFDMNLQAQARSYLADARR